MEIGIAEIIYDLYGIAVVINDGKVVGYEIEE